MKMKYNISTFVYLLFCFSSCAQRTSVKEQLQLLDSGMIFTKASFQSCHASTLTELPGSKIMAAWFGGKNEGDPDVSIWMSIKENGKWSLPEEIANGMQQNNERFACWNPVLFLTRSGLLFLYYRVGLSPQTWWTEIKTSTDNGETWSAARKLPPVFLGPIKNKPIQLNNGDILCPSSIENPVGNKWTIHLERSDSNGNNWSKINIDCDTFNVIQPTLLTYGRDSIQLLCRSRNNVIVQSWSFDDGNTWQPLKSSSLPNPNSGIDAVSLREGSQLLVYNPLQRGRNGRAALRIAISTDGEHWKDCYTLEEHEQGEFSYPAIIQAKDGSVHITYTYERRKIKYVRVK